MIEFIPYQLAVIAKAKGFDEPCMSYFESKKLSHLRGYFIKNQTLNENYILRPTHQQIVDWFRVKYKIEIHVKGFEKTKNIGGYEYCIADNAIIVSKENRSVYYYDAFNTAIEEAFKLIKK